MNRREAGRRETQGGVRASSSGHVARASGRAWSRGRGRNGHRILRRVPADGRHLGSREAWLFTERCRSWPWRLTHAPTRARRRARRGARARGDRGVRGSIARGRHGSNMPMLAPPQRGRGSCPVPIRRSGSGVVKHLFPRSCHAEPETPWGLHAVKAAAVSWERARCGYTPRFRWQMSVGRVARLGRREVARSRGGLSRVLAGRKPEAPLTTGTGGDKANRRARISRNPNQEGAHDPRSLGLRS